MMNSPNSIKLFKDRNISYVVSRDEKNAKFNPNGSPHWKLIYRDNKYTVYRLID